MKKNRARSQSKKNTPDPITNVDQNLNSMRGLVQAARVSYTRRLITPAKAMAQINELTRRSQDVIRQIRDNKRPSPATEHIEVSNRRPNNKRQLLRQVLSAQVRNLHYDARRSLVCASRASRREVLFALQRTGKNGNRNRKAVWSPLSHISCKKRG